jgi:hypothetical protein
MLRSSVHGTVVLRTQVHRTSVLDQRQDFGAEDRNPPDDDSPQTPGLPLPGSSESGDIEDPGTTQGSSDPMPNMSGTS